MPRRHPDRFIWELPVLILLAIVLAVFSGGPDLVHWFNDNIQAWKDLFS